MSRMSRVSRGLERLEHVLFWGAREELVKMPSAIVAGMGDGQERASKPESNVQEVLVLAPNPCELLGEGAHIFRGGLGAARPEIELPSLGLSPPKARRNIAEELRPVVLEPRPHHRVEGLGP